MKTRNDRGLFGDIVKTISASGLTLTETEYFPKAEVPLHSHSFPYYCFVLKGSFTEKYGTHERDCRPSSLIFHSKGEVHSDNFYETGGRCFNIQLGNALIDRAGEYSIGLDNSAQFYKGKESDLAASLYREFRFMDDLSPLAIEGLTLELMVATARRSVKGSKNYAPNWIVSVRDILHERFSEPLTLSEIADSVGRHPVHVARAFRQHYLCTIGSYVRQLRIDHAIQLLSGSDRSLVEIAISSGFAHQSHFSKTFKLLVGKTPTEYRDFSRSR